MPEPCPECRTNPTPAFDPNESGPPLCEDCSEMLAAEMRADKREPTLRDRDDEDSRKYDEWKDRG